MHAPPQSALPTLLRKNRHVGYLKPSLATPVKGRVGMVEGGVFATAQIHPPGQSPAQVGEVLVTKILGGESVRKLGVVGADATRTRGVFRMRHDPHERPKVPRHDGGHFGIRAVPVEGPQFLGAPSLDHRGGTDQVVPDLFTPGLEDRVVFGGGDAVHEEEGEFEGVGVGEPMHQLPLDEQTHQKFLVVKGNLVPPGGIGGAVSESLQQQPRLGVVVVVGASSVRSEGSRRSGWALKPMCGVTCS